MNIVIDYLNEHKISKYNFSKISGIPYSTLCDICSGKTPVKRSSAETIYKLSRAMHVSADDILASACQARGSYEYLSGTYALNLPSPDGTPGDWHFYSIDWQNAKLSNTNQSSFGTWGLYKRNVPYHGTMLVANHVRACLDLIEHGYFGSAQGMKDNFLCDNRYTKIIFKKIYQLKDSKIWSEIDRFMGDEYLCQWLAFKDEMAVAKKE